MRVLIIPGFWLPAVSFAPLVSALARDGFDARALSLPGVSSRSDDRRHVTWAEHVAAVVSEVDGRDDDVVLVGHSAGGALAHACADARPHRVRRVVYVDAIPPVNGECVNASLSSVDGEIPLPDWTEFPAGDLVDMSDDLLAQLRAGAIPVPAHVATDPVVLRDPRRHRVPITIIACGFTRRDVESWIGDADPAAAELAAMEDVTYVELSTGHWPHLSRPLELALALREILRSS